MGQIVVAAPTLNADPLASFSFLNPELAMVLLAEMSELNIPKDARILDLGAGNGSMARVLLDGGYDQVTCADRCRPSRNLVPGLPFIYFDMDFLALALRRGKDGLQAIGDAQALNQLAPYMNVFDVVVAMQVEQSELVMSEMAKFFLKIGGYIYPDSDNELLGPEFEMRARFYQYLGDDNRSVSTIQSFI